MLKFVAKKVLQKILAQICGSNLFVLFSHAALIIFVEMLFVKYQVCGYCLVSSDCLVPCVDMYVHPPTPEGICVQSLLEKHRHHAFQFVTKHIRYT